jgi:hypothetical protein
MNLPSKTIKETKEVVLISYMNNLKSISGSLLLSIYNLLESQLLGYNSLGSLSSA